MPQRRNLLQPERSHRRHRAMAQSIQHEPAALFLELSATSAPNIHSQIASAGSELHDAIISIGLVQNIRQVRAEGPGGRSNPETPEIYKSTHGAGPVRCVWPSLYKGNFRQIARRRRASASARS